MSLWNYLQYVKINIYLQYVNIRKDKMAKNNGGDL